MRHSGTPSASAPSRKVRGTRTDHLLGRARDRRDHQHGERDASGEGREAVRLEHDERVREETRDDGRRRVQGVVTKRTACGKPPGAELGQVDPGEDPDGIAMTDARRP